MAYKDKHDPRLKEARRKHYRNNKEAYFNRNKIAKEKKKAIINKLKDAPCVDCGKKYPPCVMDFDHVRGEKLGSIATLMFNVSMKKVFEEIKKCELVCANCHRIRTHLK